MRKGLAMSFLRKALKTTAIVLALAVILSVAAELGAIAVSIIWKPWEPDYQREDISAVLEKELRTDADYDMLFKQTGLSRIAIDELISDSKTEKILEIQDDFFEKDGYTANHFDFSVVSFERDGGGCYSYPILRDGDIICSFSSHLSFLNIGHAAIVVNGRLELIAESTGYSSVLSTVLAKDFFTSPSFVVLRPKCDERLCLDAAEYVKLEAVGTEYDFFAGIFEPKATVPLRKTHCSHIVWYAYERLGIDLDSNGGKIVTPADILASPYLEVIQVRGVDIYSFDP